MLDLHPLLAKRRSPHAFAETPLDPHTLTVLFEAIRWSPSCFNEQPWRYLVATIDRPDDHAAMVACLVEGNRVWAKHAPLLLLAVAQRSFTRNGKPNPHAWHDVGIASAMLTVQATTLGLAVHQMAGILADTAREHFGIPDGFDPVSAIAVGYEGDATSLPEALRTRDAAPRTRHPQETFAFRSTWQR